MGVVYEIPEMLVVGGHYDSLRAKGQCYVRFEQPVSANDEGRLVVCSTGSMISTDCGLTRIAPKLVRARIDRVYGRWAKMVRVPFDGVPAVVSTTILGGTPLRVHRTGKGWAFLTSQRSNVKVRLCRLESLFHVVEAPAPQTEEKLLSTPSKEPVETAQEEHPC